MGTFGAAEKPRDAILTPDAAERGRRPRDPPADRRVGRRRAPRRDRRALAPRRSRRRDASASRPRRSRAAAAPSRRLRRGAATDGLLPIAAPMLGTFYRAEAPGRAAVRRRRGARRAGHGRLPDRGHEDDERGPRRRRRGRSSRCAPRTRSSWSTGRRSSGCSRTDERSADERARRHRRHDDARRQPEPVERDRA